MRKIKICFIISITVFLISISNTLQGQVSGSDKVIIHSKTSFIHPYTPAIAGTSYVWEVENGNIIFEAWDSVVVKWDREGEYNVSLSLFDSSDYSTELLEELPVSVTIPVVKYSYDAAGNRTSRTIVYYSSTNKKSKKSKQEIETKLETSDLTMVYPNPSKNVIYLKLNNIMSKAENIKYILYDNFGKMVMQKDINNTLTEIDVSHLNDGMYYLELIYDNHRKNWKIIKY